MTTPRQLLSRFAVPISNVIIAKTVQNAKTVIIAKTVQITKTVIIATTVTIVTAVGDQGQAVPTCLRPMTRYKPLKKSQNRLIGGYIAV